MLVYRIALEKFSNSLVASGRAARWNSNDVAMIYTASSTSLACLENVVHRNQLGLSKNFMLMTIDIPDDLEINVINLEDLPKDWKDFNQLPYTQNLGNKWIEELKTPIFKIPSSIINLESNYIINPKHPDFQKIKLIKREPFMFDERIKR